MLASCTSIGVGRPTSTISGCMLRLCGHAGRHCSAPQGVHPQMAAQAPPRRRQPGASRRSIVCLCAIAAKPMAKRANQCDRTTARGVQAPDQDTRPCCHQPRPPPCCSGRYSPPARSTCARSMAGRRSPQPPSISQLTLPLETITSCPRKPRHIEFQHNPRRHLETP